MYSSLLPLNPGDVVASMYQVGHVLGIGAMGAVVAATDLSTGMDGVIKCLLSKHAKGAVLVRRFAREAHVAARLRSKHSVRILHYGMLGVADRALPYIVMERLEGSDLAWLLQCTERLNASTAADYISQACNALDEAHALGVVHRDIKLENLFVARAEGAEIVKVLDFGMAKVMNPSAASDEYRLTEHENTLGTLSYMAPEQISDPIDVDARADIWSLGVTLFRLITGVAPFQGDNPVDLALSILHERPPSLERFRTDIPRGLDAVVQQCLEKRRGRRYQNATELRRALAGFIYGFSRTAETSAPQTRRLLMREATLLGLQPSMQGGC
jgi:serine/threonine-protein kinase